MLHLFLKSPEKTCCYFQLPHLHLPLPLSLSHTHTHTHTHVHTHTHTHSHTWFANGEELSPQEEKPEDTVGEAQAVEWMEEGKVFGSRII